MPYAPRLVGALVLPLALLVPAAARAQTPRPSSPPPVLVPQVVTQLRLGLTQGLDADAAPPVLELRRLRVGLRGSALQGALTGLVVVNATPSALELLDAWAEGALGHGHRLRVGLAKVSFTTYRMGSFTDLVFVDWALVTRAFGTERQLGAEFHNLRSGHRWEYAVGLWHGTTSRAAHGRGVADVYAEPVVNRSDLRALYAFDAPHPELSARLQWHNGAPAGRLQVHAGLNALYDLRPVAAHDFRLTVAPELALSLGAFGLDVTAYLGLAELTTQSGVGTMTGLLAEAHAAVSRRVTLGLRYARVDVGQSLRDDARARAAQLRTAAPNDQQAEVGRRYADAGRTETEHGVGLAVRVDLLPPHVRWHSDLGWTQRRGDFAPRDEIAVRTQFQLAF